VRVVVAAVGIEPATCGLWVATSPSGKS